VIEILQNTPGQFLLRVSRSLPVTVVISHVNDTGEVASFAFEREVIPLLPYYISKLPSLKNVALPNGSTMEKKQHVLMMYYQ